MERKVINSKNKKQGTLTHKQFVKIAKQFRKIPATKIIKLKNGGHRITGVFIDELADYHKKPKSSYQKLKSKLEYYRNLADKKSKDLFLCYIISKRFAEKLKKANIKLTDVEYDELFKLLSDPKSMPDILAQYRYFFAETLSEVSPIWEHLCPTKITDKYDILLKMIKSTTI